MLRRCDSIVNVNNLGNVSKLDISNCLRLKTKEMRFGFDDFY